jgi:hypothetical protein
MVITEQWCRCTNGNRAFAHDPRKSALQFLYDNLMKFADELLSKPFQGQKNARPEQILSARTDMIAQSTMTAFPFFMSAEMLYALLATPLRMEGCFGFPGTALG